MKNHVTIEQAFEICNPLQHEVNDMTHKNLADLKKYYRDCVESGVNKSILLDSIVANLPQYNPMFIRLALVDTA